MSNINFEWYPAQSADATHADEEVDLAKLGRPAGASWAYVALTSSDLSWGWGIMDRWLHEDATQLAQGEERSKTEAKLAVQRWVTEHEHVVETTSYEQALIDHGPAIREELDGWKDDGVHVFVTVSPRSDGLPDVIVWRTFDGLVGCMARHRAFIESEGGGRMSAHYLVIHG